MIKGLVIAGGQSSRMKTDKAALVIDGEPLFQKITRLLTSSLTAMSADQTHASVFLSARTDSAFLAAAKTPVLFDDLKDIGPAAALLRAHREDPSSLWLVVACDFPLAERETFESLLKLHRSITHPTEVTCYVHGDSTPEPLFAIWSPDALEQLNQNVSAGLTGPIQTLRQLKLSRLEPENERWLLNTNTPEDWERANGIIERRKREGR